MSIFSIIRPVMSVASGLGVGIIVGNAVAATTPANVGKLQKVLITIGAYGIGGLAGKVVSEHVDKDIVAIEDVVNQLRGKKTDESGTEPTDVTE